MRSLRHSAAILCFSVAANAQTGSIAIAGRVLDSKSDPVDSVDVSVTVDERVVAIAARTDAKGRYRLTIARPANVLTVSARRSGYSVGMIRITVPTVASEVAAPDIRLSNSAPTLPVVRTVAARPVPSRATTRMIPGEQATISDPTSFISTDLTGDFTGDPSLALAAIPGLAVTASSQNGSPTYSIPGLSSNQNQLRITARHSRVVSLVMARSSALRPRPTMSLALRVASSPISSY